MPYIAQRPAFSSRSCTWMMINFALNVPDEVWQSRLHASDAAGLPDYSAADEQFNLIMRYFTEPGTDEGFKVVGYG